MSSVVTVSLGLSCLPFSTSQGQSRVRRPMQCCEECVSPAGSCSSNGIVHYQHDMWKGSPCEFCMCHRGQVTCQPAECAKVECAQVRSKRVVHSAWSSFFQWHRQGPVCSSLLGSRGDSRIHRSHFKGPFNSKIL